LNLLKKITNELTQWLEALLIHIPGGTGLMIRAFYYRRIFSGNGRLSIGYGCEFVSKKRISIKGKVFIGKSCFFSA
jgi:hypothetical protein